MDTEFWSEIHEEEKEQAEKFILDEELFIHYFAEENE